MFEVGSQNNYTMKQTFLFLVCFGVYNLSNAQQNVGIGTNNPVHPLHVSGAASGSAGAAIYGQNTANVGNGVYGVSNAVGTNGVQGLSANGTGVLGYSNGYRAISGSTITGTALYGNSSTGYGLEVVGKLKISGGNTNPSNGAVLTSDASGNAVWKRSRIGFSAVSGSGSILANQAILIPFNTKNYDASNNFNTSGAVSNPSSFIAPVAGFYHFDASININIASSVSNLSEVSIYLMKNGEIAVIEEYGPALNTAFQSHMYMNFSIDMPLNAGDIINLRVYQTNATNVTGSFIRGRFTGHLIFAH